MEFSTFQIGISTVVTILLAVFGYIYKRIDAQKKDFTDIIDKINIRLNQMVSRNEFEKTSKERYDQINQTLQQINQQISQLNERIFQIVSGRNI